MGFMCMLCIIMVWKDWKLMIRFLIGFQAVGILEDSRIWSLVGIAEPESEKRLLLERKGLLSEIERKPINEDTAFLWESLMAEKELGVADPPVEADVLDKKYGPGTYMPTPCFCHTQACGKTRRIDNAKRAGKNRQTSRSERFTLTNALMPALMLKIIYAVAAVLGPQVYKDITSRSFESGGEDMPNAFRAIPTERAHLIIP